MKNRFFFASLFVFFICSLAAATRAERGDGRGPSRSGPTSVEITISGRVTDFSGNPVEGAQVELKDDHFKNVASVLSGKDGGLYMFRPLMLTTDLRRLA